MQLANAIRHRRSTAPVTAGSPGDAELRSLLSLAMHAPDHAGLRPWRLVTLRGTQRDRLGAAFVRGFGDRPGTPEATKTASRPLRAPLLIGIVLMPVEHPKVPEWEQLAATVAVVTTLQLLLFEAGWTAMWRTGPAAGLPEVVAEMGVGPGEKLLGWLYVGGTELSSEPTGEDAYTSGGSGPGDPEVGGHLVPLT
jgi:nitroreductase